MSQALESENPDVTANRPKETLELLLKPTVQAPVPQRFDLSLVGAMVADYEKARGVSTLFARVYRLQPRYFELVGNGITAEATCGVAFTCVVGGVAAKIGSLPRGCIVSTHGCGKGANPVREVAAVERGGQTARECTAPTVG